MAINPETNKIEPALKELFGEGQQFVPVLPGRSPLPGQLVRPNGEPVPDHWPILAMDEEIVIKGYVFAIRYIGETSIVLEPVRPAP